MNSVQHMNSSPIVRTFAALGDGTRMTMVEALAARPRSVSELSGTAAMTLAGAMKHLKVLETAGVVTRQKQGRTVTYTLSPTAFSQIVKWADRQGRFWEQSLRRLGQMVANEP